MEENAFDLDENGEIIYSGTITCEDNLFGADDLESEIVDDAENVDTIIDTGNLFADEMEDQKDVSEDIPETSVDLENGVESDRAISVVLSDDLTEALLSSTTPAGGALTSTTLDYFDRVVGSLPSGYVYVAYRTDSDSSYNGVLYYGKNYTVKNDVVSFGSDARQIRVERVTSGSSYSYYTTYKEYSAADVQVSFSRSGDVVYYSNAEIGYPILGGYDKPLGIGTYLTVGIVVAFAVAVLGKILRR